jgi:hypothetical protein
MTLDAIHFGVIAVRTSHPSRFFYKIELEIFSEVNVLCIKYRVFTKKSSEFIALSTSKGQTYCLLLSMSVPQYSKFSFKRDFTSVGAPLVSPDCDT